MEKKRYTIEELRTMRESEDHVEFKKGEHGNVSYNETINETVNVNDNLNDGLKGNDHANDHANDHVNDGVNDGVKGNDHVNDGINGNDHVNDHVNDGVNGNDHVNDHVNDGINGNDHVNDHLKLANTEIATLNAINSNKELTHAELIELLGKSQSTITRSVRRLRKEGLLVRIGSDKTGSWRITDKGMALLKENNK